ncbi:periplasmic heavy metal sensor [Maricaulis sp.]|uniref:periplasmic heavy metal sensor n=1 Tax=Maricaulis sp. TaxID=1486257 RepID=UPI00261A6189|nr:periplasmic heavy metal sensor [Maricaulis sp.]
MNSPTPWIIALIASVLINGALIGFLIQREVAPSTETVERAAGPERDAGPRGFNVRRFIAALPPEDRREARRRMREEAPRSRALMRESHMARRQAEMAMIAEPFDAEAAQAALANMRTSRHAVEAHIEGVLIELVADLDADTRARVLREARGRSFREEGERAGPRRRPPPPPGGG